jgi:hypothetical protein
MIAYSHPVSVSYEYEEPELPGIPKKQWQELTPEERLSKEITKYRRAQRDHGPLINQKVASTLLGLTHTRVQQFVHAGRLSQWCFFDENFLSLPEVEDFRKVKRPTGRPKKQKV